MNDATRPMQFQSRWVLITGASSGLGLEIARLLAKEHKANLVLIARRGERLAEIKAELESSHGVSVVPISADLSNEADVERAFREATDGRTLYAAILNAGITYFGEHVALPWSECKRMLHTNITAVAQLAHLSIPHLLAANEGGGVLFVASMAGMTPVPYQSLYSGTKAFVVGFGHSLWHELKGKNVSMTTFVPGGIATDMTENAGLSNYFGTTGPHMQTSAACARDAVHALQRRKHTYVPGLVNRLGVIASKMLPRSLIVGLVAAEYRKALALKERS